MLSAEGPLFRVSADSHATKSFRRPYGRHFCCFLPRAPFLGFRQIPTQQNHAAVRTDGIFFTFGESHVTRLTLPCNNRYSVAPLLTIPLGGTNCLSFRQAFLLLSAEGPLFRVSADSHATKSFRRPYGRHFCCFLPRAPFLGFRQIPTQQNHAAVRTDGIFFTFGESHVTRLTLPCNNRYSVAPLLTIPLGGTNCLSFRSECRCRFHGRGGQVRNRRFWAS